jgi:hypothetical protein
MNAQEKMRLILTVRRSARAFISITHGSRVCGFKENGIDEIASISTLPNQY